MAPIGLFFSALLATSTVVDAAPTLFMRSLGHLRSPYLPRANGVQIQNARDAQKLNAQFAGLKETDSCDDEETACISGGFAQCVQSKWQVSPCSVGTQCFALPLVNSNGTSLSCDTPEDAAKRFDNAGVQGGVDGSNGSAAGQNSTQTDGNDDNNNNKNDNDDDSDCSDDDNDNASSGQIQFTITQTFTIPRSQSTETGTITIASATASVSDTIPASTATSASATIIFSSSSSASTTATSISALNGNAATESSVPPSTIIQLNKRQLNPVLTTIPASGITAATSTAVTASPSTVIGAASSIGQEAAAVTTTVTVFIAVPAEITGPVIVSPVESGVASSSAVIVGTAATQVSGTATAPSGGAGGIISSSSIASATGIITSPAISVPTSPSTTIAAVSTAPVTSVTPIVPTTSVTSETQVAPTTQQSGFVFSTQATKPTFT